MRNIFRLIAILAVILCVASCLAGKYLCNRVLKPEPHGEADIERTRHKADSLLPGVIAWYDSLHLAGIFRDTTLTGGGDCTLHAVFAPAAAPAEAQGTAVVVHGYTDNHLVFLYLVKMYRDTFNYNVMVPDLHYHGYSGGDAVQMGWLDRLDVEKWAEMAHALWNDDFMVVHGVSMGAATAMMMSGDSLPPYIRAFVEDCGYASVWDQLKANLKQSFHLPPFPVLHSANVVCRKRYGWDFKEASSVKQLAKCERPMLFIHGDADDFVPLTHLRMNYDAKVNGYKEMWVAEGAVHANAYAKHPEEYTRRVQAFLEKAKTLN
ncbi:MAG: alpha/beta hydrolase [Bacteroidales bacterium]|nr:alpha/beta hydrolase [Bacteroidales bacterium]MBR0299783.1 alpha/beta hydrolase [Bacteroidales bacterium]